AAVLAPVERDLDRERLLVTAELHEAVDRDLAAEALELDGAPLIDRHPSVVVVRLRALLDAEAAHVAERDLELPLAHARDPRDHAGLRAGGRAVARRARPVRREVGEHRRRL